MKNAESASTTRPAAPMVSLRRENLRANTERSCGPVPIGEPDLSSVCWWSARRGSGPSRYGSTLKCRMAQAERIVSWMRRALASAGARGFVVGLSGGLDSAVVARIAQLAAPGAVLGVILPCHSDPRD